MSNLKGEEQGRKAQKVDVRYFGADRMPWSPPDNGKEDSWE